MDSFDNIFYKELVFEDLGFLTRRPYNELLSSNFFRININNPLGCSISDASSFFEKISDVASQFGIYRENKPIPLALVRFGQINNLFQSVDVSLLVICDDDLDVISHSIKELIELLSCSSRVNKFYTMLTQLEIEERHVFISLGFKLEMTFPKYFYYQGFYHDVSVYNLLMGHE